MEAADVNKSFKDWLGEGEELYNATLAEFQQLEAQLVDLEQRLASKKAEVNQIAGVIGKQPVESTNRRMTAEIIDPGQGNNLSNSPATIARALTGRGLGR